MSLREVIPEELLSADKKGDFFSWLRLFPAPVHTKKYMLMDWAEFVEVKLRRIDFEAVNIPIEV